MEWCFQQYEILCFIFILILEVLSVINSKHLETYSQNALFLM